MLQNAVFQCARKRPEVPGSARKCPEAPGSARKSARKSARSMPGSARNFAEKFAFTPPQNQFCMDFWANLCEKLLGCTNTQKKSKFRQKSVDGSLWRFSKLSDAPLQKFSKVLLAFLCARLLRGSSHCFTAFSPRWSVCTGGRMSCFSCFCLYLSALMQQFSLFYFSKMVATLHFHTFSLFHSNSNVSGFCQPEIAVPILWVLGKNAFFPFCGKTSMPRFWGQYGRGLFTGGVSRVSKISRISTLSRISSKCLDFSVFCPFFTSTWYHTSMAERSLCDEGYRTSSLHLLQGERLRRFVLLRHRGSKTPYRQQGGVSLR